MEHWETIAFHPEFPAVPGILVMPNLAGQPKMHRIDPVGGAAMIDKYACAVLTGMYANSEMHPFDDEEAVAEEVWRVAIAMAKTRPRFEPPAGAINSKPRLLE